MLLGMWVVTLANVQHQGLPSCPNRVMNRMGLNYASSVGIHKSISFQQFSLQRSSINKIEDIDSLAKLLMTSQMTTPSCFRCTTEYHKNSSTTELLLQRHTLSEGSDAQYKKFYGSFSRPNSTPARRVCKLACGGEYSGSRQPGRNPWHRLHRRWSPQMLPNPRPVLFCGRGQDQSPVALEEVIKPRDKKGFKPQTY